MTHTFESLFNRLYKAVVYLEFYDKNLIISKSEPIYKLFTDLLESKLKFKEWERDMVYMKNLFEIKTFSGRRIIKTFQLILYGKTNKIQYTATAYLVGKTGGIITDCIINKKHSPTLLGVVVPFDEVISNEVLKIYQTDNIGLYEKTELVTKF